MPRRGVDLFMTYELRILHNLKSDAKIPIGHVMNLEDAHHKACEMGYVKTNRSSKIYKARMHPIFYMRDGSAQILEYSLL